jgi:hypothetical protein
MRAGDQNVIENLRQKFKDEIAHLTDDALINEYNEFSMSDMHGDNDKRFLEWLEINYN